MVFSVDALPAVQRDEGTQAVVDVRAQDLAEAVEAWQSRGFRLDAIGPARVIDKIRAEGAELPAMLAVLAESGADSFYRADGTEYLGLDGQWHSVS